MHFLLRPNPMQPGPVGEELLILPADGTGFKERSDRARQPLPAVASMPGSSNHKLYKLWVAVALVAIIAAGFFLSYVAYNHLAAGTPLSLETMGELWDGHAP